MKSNVGKTDRMIRFLLGIVIIAAGLYYQSWWGVIGIVPIITGALSWCPPYKLLGISTDKK
jgi:sulfite exporter TauE/SafE